MSIALGCVPQKRFMRKGLEDSTWRNRGSTLNCTFWCWWCLWVITCPCLAFSVRAAGFDAKWDRILSRGRRNQVCQLRSFAFSRVLPSVEQSLCPLQLVQQFCSYAGEGDFIDTSAPCQRKVWLSWWLNQCNKSGSPILWRTLKPEDFLTILGAQWFGLFRWTNDFSHASVWEYVTDQKGSHNPSPIRFHILCANLMKDTICFDCSQSMTEHRQSTSSIGAHLRIGTRLLFNKSSNSTLRDSATH